jgi:hypothetical protein
VSSYEDILAGLLRLDTDQLAEVRARAGILSQAGGAKARTSLPGGKLSMPAELAETDVELILSEIAGHLKEQGIEFVSVQMLKNVGGYRKFADKVPGIMIYFRKVTTNRVKLRALIRMSIALLYKDLARMNISASTRTMMNHFHRIPAVVNRSFPGYASSGMLGLLLQEPLHRRIPRRAEYVSNEPRKKRGPYKPREDR